MHKSDLPYFSQILAIQDTLEIYYKPISSYKDNYLYNRCQETTKFANTVLPNLEEKAGFFKNMWHAWNYDTEHEIILDFSAWQFQGLNISTSNPVFSKKSQYHTELEKELKKHQKQYNQKIYSFDKSVEDLLKVYDNIKSGY